MKPTKEQIEKILLDNSLIINETDQGIMLSRLKADATAQAIIDQWPEPQCTWTEDDPYGPTPYTYTGTCGIYYYVERDGPSTLSGDGCNYCPKCGGKITEVPYPVEVEDE